MTFVGFCGIYAFFSALFCLFSMMDSSNFMGCPLQKEMSLRQFSSGTIWTFEHILITISTKDITNPLFRQGQRPCNQYCQGKLKGGGSRFGKKVKLSWNFGCFSFKIKICFNYFHHPSPQIPCNLFSGIDLVVHWPGIFGYWPGSADLPFLTLYRYIDAKKIKRFGTEINSKCFQFYSFNWSKNYQDVKE